MASLSVRAHDDRRVIIGCSSSDDSGVLASFNLTDSRRVVNELNYAIDCGYTSNVFDSENRQISIAPIDDDKLEVFSMGQEIIREELTKKQLKMALTKVKKELSKLMTPMEQLAFESKD